MYCAQQSRDTENVDLRCFLNAFNDRTRLELFLLPLLPVFPAIPGSDHESSVNSWEAHAQKKI